MKKYFISFVIFSFALIQIFAIETVITPSMSYTNYFSKTKYVSSKSYLHAFSIGLDLMFVGKESCFTFFFNNHISFTEGTKGTGEIDFINAKGAQIIENMLFDTSLLIGYTFGLTEELVLRLGGGLGLFHGYYPIENKTATALGSVLTFSLEYFFIRNLGISFGMEDGIYGSVRKVSENGRVRFFNRVQTKIGLAIRFS
ncbi:MAG: DUF2715 domain-containing protein [Treponema sp.]